MSIKRSQKQVIEPVKGFRVDGTNHPLDASLSGNSPVLYEELLHLSGGNDDFEQPSWEKTSENEYFSCEFYRLFNSDVDATLFSIDVNQPGPMGGDPLVVTYDGTRYLVLAESGESRGMLIGDFSLCAYPFCIIIRDGYNGYSYFNEHSTEGVEVEFMATTNGPHEFSVERVVDYAGYFGRLSGMARNDMCFGYVYDVNPQQNSFSMLSHPLTEIDKRFSHDRKIMAGDDVLVQFDSVPYLLRAFHVDDLDGVTNGCIIGDKNFVSTPFYAVIDLDSDHITIHTYDEEDGDSSHYHSFTMTHILKPWDCIPITRVFKVYDSQQSEERMMSLLEILEEVLPSCADGRFSSISLESPYSESQ